jgi:hypothetical protein
MTGGLSESNLKCLSPKLRETDKFHFSPKIIILIYFSMIIYTAQ